MSVVAARVDLTDLQAELHVLRGVLNVSERDDAAKHCEAHRANPERLLRTAHERAKQHGEHPAQQLGLVEDDHNEREAEDDVPPVVKRGTEGGRHICPMREGRQAHMTGERRTEGGRHIFPVRPWLRVGQAGARRGVFITWTGGSNVACAAWPIVCTA